VLLAALAGAALAAGSGNPKIAVLDLRAAVGGAPPDYGVTAARLIADAFQGTGKYEAVDPDIVRDALAKRQLQPPFGVGHLQLLADVLKADLLVHGSVRSLTLEPEKHSASVVLSVEIVEGASGNLRKRAQATGTYAAQAGEGDREVLLAALADAAGKVVASATGLAVRPTSAEETTGRAIRDQSGSATAAGANLAAALLPPVEVADDVPLIGTPTGSPGSAPSPSGPRVSVIESAGPQTAGARAGGGLQTKPDTPSARPPTKVTVAQKPPTEPTTEELPSEDVAPLVRAKILAKLSADRVLITLGKDALVTPKMELEVYRVTVSRDETVTKRRVGKIRVVKINPTDAEARILEGADLMATGDVAYNYGE